MISALFSTECGKKDECILNYLSSILFQLNQIVCQQPSCLFLFSSVFLIPADSLVWLCYTLLDLFKYVAIPTVDRHNHGLTLFTVSILLYHTWNDFFAVMPHAAPLAVLLSLRVGQVVEVQENGGVGELATIGRQVQELLCGARHRANVHVPHLLRRVQLEQLLLDLQVLLNVPALVFELQDGFGVAVDGGDWRHHAGCEGAPCQTTERDTSSCADDKIKKEILANTVCWQEGNKTPTKHWWYITEFLYRSTSTLVLQQLNRVNV